MKFFFKFFIVIFFLFIPNISYSEQVIAYIDMDKIMNNSKAGQSINQTLEKMHKENIGNFKKIETELRDKESEIISQKKILSKDEYENKIKELRKRVKDYRNNRKKIIDSLNKKRLDTSEKLADTITPLLAEYSEKNSISIIIQKKNIIIGKKELDITAKILAIVDENITKINLN